MRGTINPVPAPSRAAKEIKAVRRHPEMAGHRREAGRTVSVTAPASPVGGFSPPSVAQARYAWTYSGRRRPRTAPRTAYVLVSGMDLG
jgi:hypothetical protein